MREYKYLLRGSRVAAPHKRVSFASHLHVQKEALSSTGTTYRIVECFRRNGRWSGMLGIIIRQSVDFLLYTSARQPLRIWDSREIRI